MGDMSREPSMEEILSSIRRVIARDESARTGGAPLPSPAALAEPAMLDPSIFDGEIDEQDDVLELTQMSDSDMARRPASPPASDKSAPEGLPDPELLSPVSAAASRHSLDALAAVLAGGQESKAAPTPATSGDVTLNALVEAALRPMLKQWLDTNLPPMVERIVATEIARITGGR